MNIFWSLVFVLGFVSQAYAGLLDQVLDSAKTVQQQTAQPSQAEQIKAAPRPGQGAQEPGAQRAGDEFVKLEKGVYGVPFKADLPTVLKWCEENKVTIRNSTKDQIEEKVKNLLGRLKRAKFDYETRKFFAPEAEKEIADEILDPQMDAVEKLVALQAKQLLESLQNPAGDYEGKSYLLDNEFLNGIDLQVGGVKKTCLDKRITDAVFSLTVSPSDQSQKLLNQSLQSIKITFFKDESGILTSYAARATFNNQQSDQLQKQFKTLTNILSQKYGSPALFGDATEFLGSEDADFLSVGSWGFGKIIEWKKNVFVKATVDWPVNDMDDSRHWLNDEFYVFYFESEVVGKAVALQTKALEDFKNAAASEDANKAKQMQQNF